MKKKIIYIFCFSLAVGIWLSLSKSSNKVKNKRDLYQKNIHLSLSNHEKSKSVKGHINEEKSSYNREKAESKVIEIRDNYNEKCSNHINSFLSDNEYIDHNSKFYNPENIKAFLEGGVLDFYPLKKNALFKLNEVLENSSDKFIIINIKFGTRVCQEKSWGIFEDTLLDSLIQKKSIVKYKNWAKYLHAQYQEMLNIKFELENAYRLLYIFKKNIDDLEIKNDYIYYELDSLQGELIFMSNEAQSLNLKSSNEIQKVYDALIEQEGRVQSKIEQIQEEINKFM